MKWLITACCSGWCPVAFCVLLCVLCVSSVYLREPCTLQAESLPSLMQDVKEDPPSSCRYVPHNVRVGGGRGTHLYIEHDVVAPYLDIKEGFDGIAPAVHYRYSVHVPYDCPVPSDAAIVAV